MIRPRPSMLAISLQLLIMLQSILTVKVLKELLKGQSDLKEDTHIVYILNASERLIVTEIMSIYISLSWGYSSLHGSTSLKRIFFFLFQKWRDLLSPCWVHHGPSAVAVDGTDRGTCRTSMYLTTTEMECSQKDKDTT